MELIQPILMVLVLLILILPGVYMVYRWVLVWEMEKNHENKLDDMQRQINDLKRELEKMKTERIKRWATDL